jgi:lysophospholipase L1-like esterase
VVSLSATSRILRGRSGRRVRRAAGGLAFAALCLLGLDLAVGAFFAQDLAEADQPLPAAAESWSPTMRGNPYLLWEYAPGMRDEFGIPVHINSLGLRGAEPADKPRGVRRLLATGDSSVYGFGIEDGQAYVNVAADLLGDDVEGWNAAIPGYSTFQTLNLLELRALSLEPDVLVIGNLWSDNNFDSFVDLDLLDAYSSFDGGWVSRARRALNHSRTFRLLDYRLRVEGGERAAARKVGWTVGKGQQQGRRRVEANDYARNLQAMVDLAHAYDAEVIFVLLSSQDDLAESHGEPPAWALYRQIMRDTAARNGAQVVDVPALFQGSGLGRDDLFIDEMHPTPTGHRLIGETLAASLQSCAQGEPLETRGTGEPLGAYSDPFVFGGTGPVKVAPKTAQAHDLTIQGTVALADFRGGTLQVDAIVSDSSGKVQVVGTCRLSRPGPFKLLIRAGTETVGFVVYEDVAQDGPSSGDRRFDLGGRTWTVPQIGLTGIDLVLSDAG